MTFTGSNQKEARHSMQGGGNKGLRLPGDLPVRWPFTSYTVIPPGSIIYLESHVLLVKYSKVPSIST
jgi:hypothetical protein